MRGETALQFAAHCWPFRLDDREHDCVAECSIAHQAVAAKNTVLLRAESLDRPPGLLVEPMGAELDGNKKSSRSNACPSNSNLASVLMPVF
jgi:hypothetical protein